jgi:Na+/proline symporter
MELTVVDWAVIAAYFALVTWIGLRYSGRAGTSIAEYFVSGRSLPWWIAGTSMVATSFAADTPLAVVGLTAKNGLAGNWFWWAFAAGGMFTVFVYARLWRRSEVMTDVEIISLRYSGAAARWLRYLRALYVALIVNPIIVGWVVGAMLTVSDQTVFYEGATVDGAGFKSWMLVIVMLGIVGLYSTVSGMWGVAITDVVQFVLAMFGCIWLAIVAVEHVGGVDMLRQKVVANYGENGAQVFSFIPDFSSENAWMPLHVFLIMICVQWWASWYPGAEPGGGGYVVQRMASSKDERHSLMATLWFQVAHYCVRPWPWLMVAFAALALFPDLREAKDPGVGYPMVMRELSPPGLRGLIMVSFFAAFMSTISTQMNWGASYLVRDFIQPLFASTASERQLAKYSKWASALVLLTGVVCAWIMKQQGVSVDDAWKMLAALGAGSGAVYMLRWFWWRINAWTEISAMFASLLIFLLLGSPWAQSILVGEGKLFAESLRDEETMAIVAFFTILCWLSVTFLTKPESPETLRAFYRKIRPGGPGWKPIASEVQVDVPDHSLGLQIAGALVATAMIYTILPGIGYLIFRQWVYASGCLIVSLILGLILVKIIQRLFSKPPLYRKM